MWIIMLEIWRFFIPVDAVLGENFQNICEVSFFALLYHFCGKDRPFLTKSNSSY